MVFVGRVIDILLRAAVVGMPTLRNAARRQAATARVTVSFHPPARSARARRAGPYGYLSVMVML